MSVDLSYAVALAVMTGAGFAVGYFVGQQRERRAWWLIARGLKAAQR